MCIFLDFEAHFKEVHRKHSRPDRALFVHVTSVVVSGRLSPRENRLDDELIAELQDTKATTVTLSVVEDSILRRHLVNARLL